MPPLSDSTTSQSTHQAGFVKKSKDFAYNLLPGSSKSPVFPLFSLPNELFVKVLKHAIPQQVHILTYNSRVRHLAYIPNREAFADITYGGDVRHPARRGLWRAAYPAWDRKGNYDQKRDRPRSGFGKGVFKMEPEGNGRGPLVAALVCRQLRDIMNVLLYEHVGFEFNDPRSLVIFLQRTPKKNWQRIRELSLTVHTMVIMSQNLREYPPIVQEHDMWRGWTWTGLVEAINEMSLQRLYVFAKGPAYMVPVEMGEELILQPLRRLKVKQRDSFWVVFLMDRLNKYGEEQLADSSFRLLRFHHFSGDDKFRLPSGYEGNEEGVRDDRKTDLPGMTI